jgi:hypothetical protein
MSLLRIIYYSENRLGIKKRHADLDAILTTAIRNNSKLDITGALVFDDLWFVQVLEGPPQSVDAIFDRIFKDIRHANIKLIQKKEVKERLFADWAMGLAVRTPKTESLFGHHWLNKGMNPGVMEPDTVLKLMVELASLGALTSTVPESVE